MSATVKLSSAFVNEARRVAQWADRSLAGQVEHWAKLGRAAEMHLQKREIGLLKQQVLDDATPDNTAVARGLQSITQQLGSPGAHDDIAAYLKTLPAPLYGIATPLGSSAQAEQNVRRNSDGSIEFVEHSVPAMSDKQHNHL